MLNNHVCGCVCVADRLSLSPTFLPLIESTPLCFGLGVGLLGEGAKGQPSSLCSAWVVWVCVLLSSDPGSLHRKKVYIFVKSSYIYDECQEITKVMSSGLEADKCINESRGKKNLILHEGVQRLMQTLFYASIRRCLMVQMWLKMPQNTVISLQQHYAAPRKGRKN